MFSNPTPVPQIIGFLWDQLSRQNANYLSIDFPTSRMMNNFYKDDIDLWNNFIPELEAAISREQYCDKPW